MTPGTTLPSQHHVITAPPMKILAKILRDPNPIHLDASAVAEAGLGDRVINQGPANVAYIISMVQAALPEHCLSRLKSQYLANVRDGDHVEAGGTITASSTEAIVCEAWLRVNGGANAVTATLTMVPRG